MVADEYIVGKPARISREAPVLVLHHGHEFIRPGSAANVAFNLASLGAETFVTGAIGPDPMGEKLTQTLASLDIDVGGLIVCPDRATDTKTRIIGRGDQEIQQQIVRIDRIDSSAMRAEETTALIAFLHATLPSVDAVVISDYENGVIGPAVLADLLPAARKLDIVIAVDSHGDLFRFKGVTFATPNQPEAESTLGITIHGENDLEAAGEKLRSGMEAEGVLITRGSQGMSLFQRGFPATHLQPANLHEVFDPTGAGDTTCAVFTLAVLAGASMDQAAILGNLAAGEVVKRLGAATIDAETLAGIARATAIQ
jgi:rfaE bifunctional protein kinase chain/domain